MKSVNVEEYLKREITQEEIDERVAWSKRWDEELRQANLEYPLPDDFIEYVKGRKTLLVESDFDADGRLKPSVLGEERSSLKRECSSLERECSSLDKELA
jgi:hypothetical protein